MANFFVDLAPAMTFSTKMVSRNGVVLDTTMRASDLVLAYVMNVSLLAVVTHPPTECLRFLGSRHIDRAIHDTKNYLQTRPRAN